MIFLQLWWTLMVLGGSSTLPGEGEQGPSSGHLAKFQRAVEEARSELHSIKPAYMQNGELRHRRNSIDDMLASFAQESNAAGEQVDESQEKAADAWFRDFQAGSLASNKGANEKSRRDYAKARALTELAKVKLKYKGLSADSMQLKQPSEKGQVGYDNSPLDIKLKQMQKILHQPDTQWRTVNKGAQSEAASAKSQSIEDSVIPDGVYEQTMAKLNYPHIRYGSQEQIKNNLSHEANYKLSKIEQEAAEKVTKTARYPGSVDKRSVSFNPMNEIKLKTSHRLMSKGLGPSLPSNAFQDVRRSQYVDDLMRRRERIILARQQKEQQQQQQAESNEADVEQAQYESLNELEPLADAPVNSIESMNSMKSVLDTPQSYDYLLPQYDHFKTLGNRPMPNMRDYTRDKRVALDTAPKNIEAKTKEKSSDDAGEQLDGKSSAAAPVLEKQSKVDTESKLDPDEKHAGYVKLEGESQLEVKPKLVNDGKKDGLVSDLDKPEENTQLESKESEKLNGCSKLQSESQALDEGKAEKDGKLVVARDHLDSGAKLDGNDFNVALSGGMGKQESELKLQTEHTQLTEAKAETPVESEADVHEAATCSPADLAKSAGSKSKDDEAKSAAEGSVVASITKSAERALKSGVQEAMTAVPLHPDAVDKGLPSEAERGKRHAKHSRRRKIHRHKRCSCDSEMYQNSRDFDSIERNADDQGKRVRRRCKRSIGEPQHVRDKRLLDDFEDHNGNRVRYGDLGNGLLTLQADDDVARDVEDLPFPRHQAMAYDDDTDGEQQELESLVHNFDTSRFDNMRQQAPGHNQQQLLQQPKQQGPQKSALSQFPSFNLTKLLNEISKLQKAQQPQQQQQPVQQPGQPQQTPTQEQRQQPNSQPIYMIQSQDRNKLLPSIQLTHPSQGFGYHRYFGPLFNKAQQQQSIQQQDNNAPKLNILPDPCLTTPQPAIVTTIYPDCIPVPSNSSKETPMMTTLRTTVLYPTPPIGNNDCPNLLKLNVSIKANVCGDPNTKKFSGNGTISMQSAYKENEEQDYPNAASALTGDNRARQVRGAKEKSDGKRKAQAKQKRKKNEPKKKGKAKDKGKEQTKDKDKANSKSKESKKAHICPAHRSGTDDNDTCSDSFEKLITGKVSSQIVEAVFDMVSNDPSMERLMPVLAKNRKCVQRRPKSFYQLGDASDQHLQQTEDMIKQALQAISDIIDKQMYQRACIPLRPDLVEFYDLIVKTMAEQEKCREKRENTMDSLADDFSQEVRSLDPNQIQLRSRIVKKLLRQYEELPQEDQRAVAAIRDELLMDLIYLRKMADAVERNRRNTQLQGALKRMRNDPEAEQKLSEDYSARFIKLLKTAELFKESSSLEQQQLLSSI